jgi:NADH:ubiquinone oxidoreductase subunit K
MILESTAVGLVVIGAVVLFWIGMLGLLWRRSLVGMLLGLLFAWISVAMGAIGFAALQDSPESAAGGGALVLCIAVLFSIQTATGLSIVVARIRRRGTLDADDAGLLEG